MENFLIDTADPSIALILALQREEVDNFFSGFKGKGRADDPLPDTELATRLFLEDLASAEQLLRDRAFAESTAHAIEYDAPVIRDLLREEAQAKRDRDLARELAETRDEVDALQMEDANGDKDDEDDDYEREPIVDKQNYVEKELREAEMICKDLGFDREEAAANLNEVEERLNDLRDRIKTAFAYTNQKSTMDLETLGAMIETFARAPTGNDVPKLDGSKDAAQPEKGLVIIPDTPPKAKQKRKPKKKNVNAKAATQTKADQCTKHYSNVPPSPSSSKPIRRNIECQGCSEQFAPSLIRYFPCAHQYCVGCTRRFFTLATTDEQVFPPQCCRQPVPLEIAFRDLSEEEINAYLDKSLEYTAPNRLYCASCSQFLPLPKSLAPGEAVFCESCWNSTCSLCKMAEHPDQRCPEDKDLELTIRVGKAKGWKECSGCGNMVERLLGCRHMTCRCGAEWCYACGARWKTCSCENAVEEELVNERHSDDDI